MLDLSCIEVLNQMKWIEKKETVLIEDVSQLTFRISSQISKIALKDELSELPVLLNRDLSTQISPFLKEYSKQIFLFFLRICSDEVISAYLELDKWTEGTEEAKKRIIKCVNSGSDDLSLSEQGLKSLPESIGKLNLRNLWIGDNQLETLPESVGNLTNLERLICPRNQIKRFPESIGNLKKLEYLLCSSNKLSTLPESFGHLENLRQLSIENNALVSLPSTFGNLVNLSLFSLNNNQLKKLPDSMCNLSKLTQLQMQDNKFEEFPSCIGSLIELERLYFQNNQLSSISINLAKLTKLEVIDLSHNAFTQFPENICTAPSLIFLSLSNNKIENIPESIGKLVTLQTLNVCYNQVSSLPFSIGAITTLRRLECLGNPLKMLPLSLICIGEFQYIGPLISYDECFPLKKLEQYLIDKPEERVRFRTLYDQTVSRFVVENWAIAPSTLFDVLSETEEWRSQYEKCVLLFFTVLKLSLKGVPKVYFDHVFKSNVLSLIFHLHEPSLLMSLLNIFLDEIVVAEEKCAAFFKFESLNKRTLLPCLLLLSFCDKETTEKVLPVVNTIKKSRGKKPLFNDKILLASLLKTLKKINHNKEIENKQELIVKLFHHFEVKDGELLMSCLAMIRALLKFRKEKALVDAVLSSLGNASSLENTLKKLLDDAFFDALPNLSKNDFTRKCQENFEKNRNPYLFHFYAASLTQDEENVRLLNVLEEILSHVLKGDFNEWRYDETRCGCKTLQMLFPEEDSSLKAEWKKGASEPLLFFLDTEISVSTLPNKKRKIATELTIVDTDDIEDLSAMGTEVLGSCLHVEGNSDQNKCLLGTMGNGEMRLIAVKNKRGMIIERAVIHLVPAKEGAVLCLEKIYPQHSLYENQILEMAKKRAAALKIPLVSQHVGDKTVPYPNKLKSKGGWAPYVYIDAGGGESNWGFFTLEKLYLQPPLRLYRT